jgi:hypothetical protein
MNAPDETEHRFAAALREPVVIALLTLLFVTGSGWVGDVIKGDCLGLFGLHQCTRGTFDSVGLSVAFALFSVSAAGLVAATRAYLPVRQLRASTEPHGHRALILTLSPLSEGVRIVDDGASIIKGEQRVDLTGKIQDDIDNLDQLKINTQQLLRAIAKHIDTVEHIVLLGSTGDKGSAGQRFAIAKLLRRYLPDAEIKYDCRPADFENLEDMRLLITDACNDLMRCGFKPSDIMIDATGGQKTTSIAAALATLHQPELQFQYVSTLKPYNVVAFDVVLESPTRIS